MIVLVDKVKLAEKALWIRQQVLEMCARAGEGRISSSLSWTEIAVALYYGRILKFDPSNTAWGERDRFVLSKGWGVICLYPIFADLGFFPKEELDKYCTPGSLLGAYGDSVPGIEIVWASIGHGLGVAAGLALAARMDKIDCLTITVLGDGECYEGSVWESAMFAGHHELNNLIAIVDRNRRCTIDYTENCLRLDPLDEKFMAFGWDVVCIDGHSYDEIFGAFKNIRSRRSRKPLMIIADTVKGKGISQLEQNPMAHVIIPAGAELEQARKDLKCPR